MISRLSYKFNYFRFQRFQGCKKLSLLRDMSYLPVRTGPKFSLHATSPITFFVKLGILNGL